MRETLSQADRSRSRESNEPTRALKIAEAAKLIGCGRQRIRTAIRDGHLPAHKVGNAWLIPRRALEQMFPAATGRNVGNT